MIITDDRTQLDTALSNPKTSVFLLTGSKTSKCGEVHDYIEERDWEDWFKWFLITDLVVLTDDEKVRWFDGNNTDRYAVVGGKDLPKNVAQKGSVDDLLKKDGTPDIIKIRKVFLAGEQT